MHETDWSPTLPKWIIYCSDRNPSINYNIMKSPNEIEIATDPNKYRKDFDPQAKVFPNHSYATFFKMIPFVYF